MNRDPCPAEWLHRSTISDPSWEAPVPDWGAFEDNAASQAMAASLGFESVDELWVVRLTDADGAM